MTSLSIPTPKLPPIHSTTPSSRLNDSLRLTRAGAALLRPPKWDVNISPPVSTSTGPTTSAGSDLAQFSRSDLFEHVLRLVVCGRIPQNEDDAPDDGNSSNSSRLIHRSLQLLSSHLSRTGLFIRDIIPLDRVSSSVSTSSSTDLGSLPRLLRNLFDQNLTEWTSLFVRKICSVVEKSGRKVRSRVGSRSRRDGGGASGGGGGGGGGRDGGGWRVGSVLEKGKRAEGMCVLVRISVRLACECCCGNAEGRGRGTGRGRGIGGENRLKSVLLRDLLRLAESVVEVESRQRQGQRETMDVPGSHENANATSSSPVPASCASPEKKKKTSRYRNRCGVFSEEVVIELCRGMQRWISVFGKTSSSEEEESPLPEDAVLLLSSILRIIHSLVSCIAPGRVEGTQIVRKMVHLGACQMFLQIAEKSLFARRALELIWGLCERSRWPGLESGSILRPQDVSSCLTFFLGMVQKAKDPKSLAQSALRCDLLTLLLRFVEEYREESRAAARTMGFVDLLVEIARLCVDGNRRQQQQIQPEEEENGDRSSSSSSSSECSFSGTNRMGRILSLQMCFFCCFHLTHLMEELMTQGNDDDDVEDEHPTCLDQFLRLGFHRFVFEFLDTRVLLSASTSTPGSRMSRRRRPCVSSEKATRPESRGCPRSSSIRRSTPSRNVRFRVNEGEEQEEEGEEEEGEGTATSIGVVEQFLGSIPSEAVREIWVAALSCLLVFVRADRRIADIEGVSPDDPEAVQKMFSVRCAPRLFRWWLGLRDRRLDEQALFVIVEVAKTPDGAQALGAECFAEMTSRAFDAQQLSDYRVLALDALSSLAKNWPDCRTQFHQRAGMGILLNAFPKDPKLWLSFLELLCVLVHDHRDNVDDFLRHNGFTVLGECMRKNVVDKEGLLEIYHSLGFLLELMDGHAQTHPQLCAAFKSCGPLVHTLLRLFRNPPNESLQDLASTMSPCPDVDFRRRAFLVFSKCGFGGFECIPQHVKIDDLQFLENEIRPYRHLIELKIWRRIRADLTAIRPTPSDSIMVEDRLGALTTLKREIDRSCELLELNLLAEQQKQEDAFFEMIRLQQKRFQVQPTLVHRKRKMDQRIRRQITRKFLQYSFQ